MSYKDEKETIPALPDSPNLSKKQFKVQNIHLNLRQFESSKKNAKNSIFYQTSKIIQIVGYTTKNKFSNLLPVGIVLFLFYVGISQQRRENDTNSAFIEFSRVAAGLNLQAQVAQQRQEKQEQGLPEYFERLEGIENAIITKPKFKSESEIKGLKHQPQSVLDLIQARRDRKNGVVRTLPRVSSSSTTTTTTTTPIPNLHQPRKSFKQIISDLIEEKANDPNLKNLIGELFRQKLKNSVNFTTNRTHPPTITHTNWPSQYSSTLGHNFSLNSSHFTKDPLNHPDKLICPTMDDLTRVPNDGSCPDRPIHNDIYKSSLFPFYSTAGPGPSTQTNGFRHAILAAISLKKSLIFSDFLTHQTDRLSLRQKVPFGARINIKKLCQFVRIKSDYDVDVQDLEKFKNETRGYKKYFPAKVAVIIHKNTTGECEGNLKQVKQYLKYYTNLQDIGQKGFTKQFTEFIYLWGLAYEMYPHKPNQSILSQFSKHQMQFDTPKIIGIGPMQKLLFKSFFKLIDAGGQYLVGGNAVTAESHAPEFDQSSAESEANVNYNLLKDLYRYTGHPEFVERLADKFIREVIQEENFIGIHWRFNHNDFLGRTPYKKVSGSSHFASSANATTKPVLQGYKDVSVEMLQEIFKTLAEPHYFMEKLVPHIEQNLPPSQNGRTVFISSPTNTAERFKTLKNKYISPQNVTYKIITSYESNLFMKHVGKNCQNIRWYLGDVLSTFEKEVMVRSKSFYRARPSNWSFNVQGQRFGRNGKLPYDRVVYDVFLGRAR